jgi:hypothetical protein
MEEPPVSINRCVSGLIALFALTAPGLAQAPPPQPAAARPAPARRPPLFFKEEWKQNEKNDEHPATAASVGNPALEMTLHGPGQDIQLTGRLGDENNPIHLWTGTSTSPVAVSFKEKNSYADLTGLARIRWNTKVSGFHQIRPIVKLADGTWLVGDRADGSSTRDWIVSEITPSDLRWLKLDIARVVTTGNFIEKVDLSRVDEIGFADLMPGSGHGPGGWVDVAQIEIYAKPVPRTGRSQ